MDVPTLDRNDGSWLADRARAWVTAGLITDEQADAIRRYESDLPTPEGEPGPERLGIVAEVAAYLGSVLALMGGVVVVGQRWSDMAMPGRLAIAIALAVVGLAAGTWLVQLAESGTTRLGTFLWVVGTAGVALTVGVLLDEIGASPEVTAIGVGIAVWLVSVELWRNLGDRVLQLFTMVIGAGIATGGVRELTDVPVWRAGIVIWVAAVVFGVASAIGWIRPRLGGLAVAAIVAMLGAAMLSDLDEQVGPAVAAITAAAVVVFALVDRSMPMLALGIVAFLIATQALLATTFTGFAGASMITVAGLVVVVVIIVRARSASPPG